MTLRDSTVYFVFRLFLSHHPDVLREKQEPILFIEPQPADLVRLGHAEDHAHGDGLVLLEFGVIEDDIKIALLRHAAHLPRNVQTHFGIAVLFQGIELGLAHRFEHILVEICREQCVVTGVHAGQQSVRFGLAESQHCILVGARQGCRLGAATRQEAEQKHD
jgi:hypothetical protein